MSWYERRTRLIAVAEIAPGYGTPRLDSDRHIGRIIMATKHGFRYGFWPADHPLIEQVNRAFAAAQRKRTMALPKRGLSGSPPAGP